MRRAYPRTMATALVVDDDPTVGDVVSAYLARAGFEVHRAADGVAEQARGDLAVSCASRHTSSRRNPPGAAVCIATGR